MNRLVAGFCLALASPLALHALTEAELLGTWDLTGYLAIRETAEGSYHLVIGDEQHSVEYALLLRVTFFRDAACALSLSLPEGGIQEVAARFQKQTIDGQEFIRLRWGGDQEVTLTLRAIDPENVTTLFFLSTTGGSGRFSAFTYDTFGTMEKLVD